MLDLRELRLWHWRKVTGARAHALRLEAEAEAWERRNPGLNARYRRQKARRYHTVANFHLKAVQVLNDYFPMGDTAEQDDAAQAPHLHR